MKVRATVAPTEDPSKVLIAVKNVVGDCQYSSTNLGDAIEVVSGDIRCLQKVHDQLRDRHVRDAARRLLLHRLSGNSIEVSFNRQAAYAGVVSVSTDDAESPLGPIKMNLQCDRPDELVDWLTAR